MEPGQGIATVQKIAINAVMAGCQPEHMPVLITAIRCLTQPADVQKYESIRTFVASTGAQGPFILINGPIAKKLNINSKCSALDPGSPSYANIVIGRAVSLMILNIGHGYPGVLSMSTIGSPLNYTLCVAENEEDSPWEPYHVEKGYTKDASTVTIMIVRGGVTFGDLTSNTAERIAWGHSWVARRVSNTSVGEWLIGAKSRHLFLVCPAQARTLAREGWDKKTLRQYVYDHAKLPFEALMFGKDVNIVKKEHPQLATCLKDNPDLLLPVVEGPECFEIAVVGGAGPCSSFFEGHPWIVTLPVEE
jgi:hypothetical protein